MKVRLTSPRVATAPKRGEKTESNRYLSHQPGDVIDVPEAEAKRMIADQLAEPVRGSVETAAVEPAENAARRGK